MILFSTVAEYESLEANSYGRVSSAALVLFEYFVTLDAEVALFWTRRPQTGASTLFLVNRYLVAMLRVANLLGFIPMSDQRCAKATRIALAFTLLQYVPWALFSGLRALALSRSKPLALIIVTLYMTTPIINISLFPFGFTGTFDPVFGCTVIDPIDLSLSRKFVIASRTCFITADLLLIFITWITVSRDDITTSITRRDTATLAGVLLRDGALYFVVLLGLHVLHLILSLCSIHVARQSLSYGYVTVFTEAFTCILVSRFLLDLQAAQRKAVDDGVASDGQSLAVESSLGCESVVFRRRDGSSMGSVVDDDRAARELLEIQEGVRDVSAET